MNGALVATGIVTVCCGDHHAAGCCDPEDCGPCCSECPTCPNPGRVLAECDAKRRIVEHHARVADPEGDDLADLCAVCDANGPEAQGWPCDTLRLLALPYADHPEYREEWRP